MVPSYGCFLINCFASLMHNALEAVCLSNLSTITETSRVHYVLKNTFSAVPRKMACFSAAVKKSSLSRISAIAGS
jgi:hypothetical protein